MTVAILAAAAVLLLARLSATDLWAPDEPRYAQVAEELRALERGAADLVLLRLNGDPYTQKPPLYYWLAALAGAPGGRVTEWAARLPSALAGIATVWLTLQLGQALFRSQAVGLWSAAILLTSFRFAHIARRAQLDVLLALFETAALVAFWRLDQASRSPSPVAEHHRATTGTLVLLHAALGCAVLTKGPVGLLPLGVMAAYLAWEGRFASMRALLPPWSFLLSLAPALLWLAGSSSLAGDGFLQDAVVENLFARFFGGASHARPFYYYAYQFPADFLPWTALWPLAAVCALRQLRSPKAKPLGELAATTSAWRLLATWVTLSVIFFSLSAGKRGLYLLPAFPAVAIACGYALSEWITRHGGVRPWVAVVSAFATAALLGGGASLALAFGPGLEFEALPGFPIPRSFGVALFAIGALCAGTLQWRPAADVRVPEHSRWRRSPGAIAAAGLICAYGVELALFSLVYPAFDGEKSPRPIARALADASPRGSRVGIFQYRSLIGGLRYYGSRKLVALNSHEEVGAFLQAGGAAIAARAKHAGALQAATPLDLKRSLRNGEREIVILAPRIRRAVENLIPISAEAPDFATDSP